MALLRCCLTTLPLPCQRVQWRSAGCAATEQRRRRTTPLPDAPHQCASLFHDFPSCCACPVILSSPTRAWQRTRDSMSARYQPRTSAREDWHVVYPRLILPSPASNTAPQSILFARCRRCPRRLPYPDARSSRLSSRPSMSTVWFSRTVQPLSDRETVTRPDFRRHVLQQ